MASSKINETGEIREWESPPITVWLPKGAYKLVGGVTSNANIVILLDGIPYNQTEDKWGSVHNIKNPMLLCSRSSLGAYVPGENYF